MDKLSFGRKFTRTNYNTIISMAMLKSIVFVLISLFGATWSLSSCMNSQQVPVNMRMTYDFTLTIADIDSNSNIASYGTYSVPAGSSDSFAFTYFYYEYKKILWFKYITFTSDF